MLRSLPLIVLLGVALVGCKRTPAPQANTDPAAAAQGSGDEQAQAQSSTPDPGSQGVPRVEMSPECEALAEQIRMPPVNPEELTGLERAQQILALTSNESNRLPLLSALYQELGEEEPQVWGATLEALIHLAAEPATNATVVVLSNLDEDQDRRIQAAIALARSGANGLRTLSELYDEKWTLPVPPRETTTGWIIAQAIPYAPNYPLTLVEGLFQEGRLCNDRLYLRACAAWAQELAFSWPNLEATPEFYYGYARATLQVMGASPDRSEWIRTAGLMTHTDPEFAAASLLDFISGASFMSEERNALGALQMQDTPPELWNPIATWLVRRSFKMVPLAQLVSSELAHTPEPTRAVFLMALTTARQSPTPSTVQAIGTFAATGSTPLHRLADLIVARYSPGSPQQLPDNTDAVYRRVRGAVASTNLEEALRVLLDESVPLELAIDAGIVIGSQVPDEFTQALASETWPASARLLEIAAYAVNPAQELLDKLSPVLADSSLSAPIAEWVITGAGHRAAMDIAYTHLASSDPDKQRIGLLWMALLGIDVERAPLLDILTNPANETAEHRVSVRRIALARLLALGPPEIADAEALALRAQEAQAGQQEATVYLAAAYAAHCPLP